MKDVVTSDPSILKSSTIVEARTASERVGTLIIIGIEVGELVDEGKVGEDKILLVEAQLCGYHLSCLILVLKYADYSFCKVLIWRHMPRSC